MNTLKIIFCGYSLLFSLLLSAQEKSFPQNIPYHTKMEVSSEALEKLFHSSGAFSLQLSPSFTLSGSIQNRMEKGPWVITLLIKTENLQDAMLSLSRSILPDGSIQYTGHLLKLHDPDGMLLVEKDNQYYFIRTEQRYLVAE
jgi:hypothetical protein